MLALGWLGREDKIKIEEVRRNRVISLRVGRVCGRADLGGLHAP